MSDSQQPTFSVTGYLPNGAQVTFISPTYADGKEAIRHIIAFTDDLIAGGFSLQQPGLEPGEDKDLIVTVMRRVKSDGTPIIDMWSAGDRSIRTFKYLRKYLNGDNDIREFLTASGFKSLDDIPLYDSKNALVRDVNTKHPKETAVPTPFMVVRKKGEERDDGREPAWELVRYESARGAVLSSGSQPAQNGTQPDWNATAVKKLIDKYGEDTVRAALGIKERWGEWEKGYADAVAAIEAFKTDEGVVF